MAPHQQLNEIPGDMTYHAFYTCTPPAPASRTRRRLSKGELRTLVYTSLGMTSTEIAQQLYLSKDTIESQRRSIMRKLHVNNMVQAVAHSLRNKIIQ